VAKEDLSFCGVRLEVACFVDMAAKVPSGYRNMRLGFGGAFSLWSGELKNNGRALGSISLPSFSQRFFQPAHAAGFSFWGLLVENRLG
jgi:hypothetical protein